MEQIASFTVNHMRLLPGIYVSRKDSTGQDVVTTYDIRMTRPNFEPVMNTAEIHTIEHLGATFLRNHEEWGRPDRVLWPYGLPYRILSYCGRRLRFRGYSAADERDVRVYTKL